MDPVGRADRSQGTRSLCGLILHGEVRAVASRISDVAISLFKKLSSGFLTVLDFGIHLEYRLRMWSIPRSNKEDIVRLVSEIKEDWGKIRILKEIKAIPNQETRAMVDLSMCLLQKIDNDNDNDNDNGLGIAQIIKQIGKFPSEEISSVIGFTSTVASCVEKEESLLQVQSIIECIQDLPSEIKQPMIDLLLPLLQGRKSSSFQNICQFIRRIFFIDAEERENVINLSSRLFKEGMSIELLDVIISQVSNLTSDERGGVVDLVEPHIKLGMTQEDIKQIFKRGCLGYIIKGTTEEVRRHRINLVLRELRCPAQLRFVDR